LKQLQGTGGTGARTYGHEGDHHDGLCSLYHFGTLFHGTSADTKEAGNKVTGLKNTLGKNQVLPPARNSLRQHFCFAVSLFDVINY
jgi:hypothetical protein